MEDFAYGHGYDGLDDVNTLESIFSLSFLHWIFQYDSFIIYFWEFSEPHSCSPSSSYSSFWMSFFSKTQSVRVILDKRHTDNLI